VNKNDHQEATSGNAEHQLSDGALLRPADDRFKLKLWAARGSGANPVSTLSDEDAMTVTNFEAVIDCAQQKNERAAIAYRIALRLATLLGETTSRRQSIRHRQPVLWTSLASVHGTPVDKWPHTTLPLTSRAGLSSYFFVGPCVFRYARGEVVIDVTRG
jgi:hypothetical protein